MQILGIICENIDESSIKYYDDSEKNERRIYKMKKNYYFTSESVTEGHPDKICDKISDAILDEALKQDPYSNMAIEATIKDDLVLIYGECNTKAILDYKQIAISTIREIGYKEHYNVMLKISEQSSEIHNAVNKDNTIGAGDQGIMFGYASDETDELMPMPIYYANKLAKRLKCVSDNNDVLGPDGKTQVTMEYVDGIPMRVDTIVISVQHIKNTNQKEIEKIVKENVIYPIIPSELIDDNTKFIINPSGSFVKGGSFGDSGTTGRKIVCDTYGGIGRIGGGCLSSKDPTKVDRSAAYYCRYVAKNIVANKLAKKCEIQVSYAIGYPNPVSIFVDTFGTGYVSDETIMTIIEKNFDFSVENIIKELNLRRPIYKETAAYGHFGCEKYSWEKIKILGVDEKVHSNGDRQE